MTQKYPAISFSSSLLSHYAKENTFIAFFPPQAWFPVENFRQLNEHSPQFLCQLVRRYVDLWRLFYPSGRLSESFTSTTPPFSSCCNKKLLLRVLCKPVDAHGSLFFSSLEELVWHSLTYFVGDASNIVFWWFLKILYARWSCHASWSRSFKSYDIFIYLANVNRDSHRQNLVLARTTLFACQNKTQALLELQCFWGSLSMGAFIYLGDRISYFFWVFFCIVLAAINECFVQSCCKSRSGLIETMRSVDATIHAIARLQSSSLIQLIPRTIIGDKKNSDEIMKWPTFAVYIKETHLMRGLYSSQTTIEQSLLPEIHRPKYQYP